MTKKIYISPSNQYANSYAYGNTTEMEQCNRIAVALEKHLKRNGYEVKRAPKGQDMNESIRESNNWGADVHIPIHTNAGGGKGALVMVHSKTTGNLKYAQPVYNTLKAISPNGGGYGVRTDVEVCGYTLGEIRETNAVTVYVEAEFHDNANLAKWIINNVDKIAAAIANGICKADGKTYKAESTTSTTTHTTYSTALLQALLRQAYAQGLCKTFIKPINNKMTDAVTKAIVECKASLGFKNPDSSINLDFIVDLEHQINVVRIGKEDKLNAELDAAQSKIIGDFNEDGKVDIKDATAIQKHIAGIK